MNVTTDKKLITCFIPKGKSAEIVRLLNEEKGINSANVTGGRGSGILESFIYNMWREVDILTVVVSEGQADEIFEFIYNRADINRIHGGFMYLSQLTKSTVFTLPEIPEED